MEWRKQTIGGGAMPENNNRWQQRLVRQPENGSRRQPENGAGYQPLADPTVFQILEKQLQFFHLQTLAIGRTNLFQKFRKFQKNQKSTHQM